MNISPSFATNLEIPRRCCDWWSSLCFTSQKWLVGFLKDNTVRCWQFCQNWLLANQVASTTACTNGLLTPNVTFPGEVFIRERHYRVFINDLLIEIQVRNSPVTSPACSFLLDVRLKRGLLHSRRSHRGTYQLFSRWHFEKSPAVRWFITHQLISVYNNTIYHYLL